MIALLIILFIVLFILTTREDLIKRLEVDEQGNVYSSSVPPAPLIESSLRKAAENEIKIRDINTKIENLNLDDINDLQDINRKIEDLDEETLKYNKVYKFNLSGRGRDRNYSLTAPNGLNYKTLS